VKPRSIACPPTSIQP